VTGVAILGIILTIDPPVKDSQPNRRRPPLWVILSCAAFLLLIWTVFQFIHAIQELNGP
jgi:hypothetical protein